MVQLKTIFCAAARAGGLKDIIDVAVVVSGVALHIVVAYSWRLNRGVARESSVPSSCVTAGPVPSAFVAAT